MQPPERGDARPQFDIGPPPCHVRGDGHRTLLARPSHDLRLLLVLLTVKYLMGDLSQIKQLSQLQTRVNGTRTHQDWLARPVDPRRPLEEGEP